MANINVSEADFSAAATAALAAKRRGDMDEAVALDKLARKINAALSTQTTKRHSWAYGARSERLTWLDMPSVLDVQ